LQAGREKEAAKKRLHSFLNIDLKEFGVWPPKNKTKQNKTPTKDEETTEQPTVEAPNTRSRTKARKAKNARK
jgi:hypothetical protein